MPTMYRAQVHGTQRGIAGNVIFYNESAHGNVSLSGVWYYDFPRNQMRAARRSSAEHLIATKAPRCTATAWIPHCR